MRSGFGGKKTWTILAALAILGLLYAWQGKVFWAWYNVRQLAGAGEANREIWIKRVIALDAAALPRLTAYLQKREPDACGNIGAALIVLARSWGAADARGAQLAATLRQQFTRLSEPGKQEALLAVAALFPHSKTDYAVSALVAQEAGNLLEAASACETLRRPTLVLAAAILEHVPQGQWREPCCELALAGLSHTDADTRVAAVGVILREPLRKDLELLKRIVPLLKDDSASVRKAALVALGPARDLVSDDDLLPLLHDPDVEVQELCTIALNSRGLADNHLHLARLISDPRPSARLQVLHYLRSDTDLEPGVWLRRLSQDSAPAVRAAAVRAVAVQTRADLRDRLRAMAQDDPSPTVRELATHYFHWHQRQLQSIDHHE